MTFDIVIVGHFSMDTIITSEAQWEEMGGVPAYSLFLTGWGLKIGVVTKWGPDFLTRYNLRIRRSGAVIAGSGKITTKFVNIYLPDGVRKQEIKETADTIRLKDFPGPFFKTKTIHFGPIINEIELEIIRNAHLLGIEVSLDPQGFCRTLDGEKVIQNTWKNAEEVLPYVDVLKITERELLLVAHSEKDEHDAINWILSIGPKIVIVTRGAQGATAITKEGEKYTVPVPHIDSIDPTGAGDAFIVSYIAARQKGNDILESLAYGSTFATLTIEKKGPLMEVNQARILERFETVKDKIRRG